MNNSNPIYYYKELCCCSWKYMLFPTQGCEAWGSGTLLAKIQAWSVDLLVCKGHFKFKQRHILLANQEAPKLHV